jgi:hypothetical protein
LLIRHATVAAALVTTAFAVLVPAAGTAASELDRAGFIREIKAAYADELRAWGLLNRNPPRKEGATAALEGSMTRLREILDDSPPRAVSEQVTWAIREDTQASASLAERLPDGATKRKRQRIDSAPRSIELALARKARALGALLPSASSGASQCGNGRDDDRDGTRDAPYDSGCSDAKDGSEGTPLTCSLGYAPGGGGYLLTGTCSGEPFKLEVIVTGAKLDTKQTPAGGRGWVCSASESTIECLRDITVANPGHRVKIGLRYKKALQAAKQVTVVTTEFSGRKHKSTLKLAPLPAKPFTLGEGPIDVTATYTNGQGGCPVATSFTAAGQFLAPGDGMLTYTLPGNQVAKGPIDPRGSFKLSNASESYVGKITGNTATATYTYKTANGCAATYNVSFMLNR